MKHKSLIFVPLVLLLLLSVSAVAADAPVPCNGHTYFPCSTNAANQAIPNRPYVHLVSREPGKITLEFVNTFDEEAFFEYRIDGQLVTSGTPQYYFTNVLHIPNQYQYPGVDVDNRNSNPSKVSHVIHEFSVNSKVEVRHALGGENDWYFDWTPFYVGQCYIDAPASVNEGASFTATVSCDGVDGVYGFQFGTSVSGDASTSATSYTKGSFVTAVDPNFITGSNTLSNYSVTRSIPAAAAANSPFTLGSVDYTAAFHLTAPGEATLTLDPLLLGDITGADLSATFASTTKVIINDLLTLELTVNSDGSITKVRDVTATVDGTSQGPVTPNPAAIAATLHFTDVIGTSTPTLTADMRSHLACGGGTVSLPLSVNSGALTLKAGDVNNDNKIDLLDSGAIGWALGKSAVTYPDVDVNGDGEINVFDLIHVGRNYNAVTESCELS